MVFPQEAVVEGEGMLAALHALPLFLAALFTVPRRTFFQKAISPTG
jgi:hypothetical protein